MVTCRFHEVNCQATTRDLQEVASTRRGHIGENLRSSQIQTRPLVPGEGQSLRLRHEIVLGTFPGLGFFSI